jgi:hypothetical protein
MWHTYRQFSRAMFCATLSVSDRSTAKDKGIAKISDKIKARSPISSGGQLECRDSASLMTVAALQNAIMACILIYIDLVRRRTTAGSTYFNSKVLPSLQQHDNKSLVRSGKQRAALGRCKWSANCTSLDAAQLLPGPPERNKYPSTAMTEGTATEPFHPQKSLCNRPNGTTRAGVQPSVNFGERCRPQAMVGLKFHWSAVPIRPKRMTSRRASV